MKCIKHIHHYEALHMKENTIKGAKVIQRPEMVL